MSKLIQRIVTCSVAAAAVAVLPLAAGSATAATQTGWVGPAGSTGYLHTSTIVNSPQLYAESKIYSTVGASAAPGKLGVRPRLFKSGALCEAVDYSYNIYSETAWSAQTTATCGTGSYNSNGFVAVFNDSKASYDQYVTFPTNPLNWTAPAAARTSNARDAAVTPSSTAAGTNSQGQKYGSAATAGATDLALISAIGTDGQLGYVRSADLNLPAAVSPSAAPKGKPATRTIPLLKADGATRIGDFTVN